MALLWWRPRHGQSLRPTARRFRPSCEPLEGRTLLDGTLDPTFGTAGKLTTDFIGSLDNPAHALALQTDGKLVVAGSVATGAVSNVAVARYNPDGSLDPGFGSGGRVVGPLGAGSGVALQADGKIVVAGTVDADFIVVRFNVDGSLDTGFGSGGRSLVDFSGRSDTANGLALQTDGKMVVVGTSQTGAGATFQSAVAVARFNPDGSLDTGFGSGGKVLTTFPYGGEAANAVSVQPDGKLVVVGKSIFAFAAVRYNPDGSLDTGFGSGGLAQAGLTYPGYGAQAVALQSDGKIVLVGATRSPGYSDYFDHYALVRFTPQGAADSTFGTNGVVSQDSTAALGSSREVGFGVAVQADGKILLAGTDGADFVVRRYSSTGTLELTVATDFGARDVAAAIVLQADGKVVTAGSTGAGADFALARYDANLQLDAGFGTQGKVTTDYTGLLDSTARAVAVQADGKLVVAGSAGTDFGIARFNPDGSLDTGFGSGGKVVTDFARDVDSAAGVVVLPDGKILAAGSAGTSFALARYNSDGSPDATFGTQGKVILAQTRVTASAGGLVAQPDGQLVLVGTGPIFGGRGAISPGLGLVRFNANGSLDTTFSPSPFPGQVYSNIAGDGTGVALQANGRLVAVGPRGGFVVGRFNPDGSPDATFASNGAFRIAFSSDTAAPHGVLVLPDGRIVVVGSSSASTSDFTLVALNANGTLDTGFGNGGTVLTDFGGDDRAATGLLQGDGRILVVGGTTASGGGFALSRYDPNGQLDASFGSGGRLVTAFPGGAAAAVTLQPDGKLVVAGSAPTANPRRHFAVARYLVGERLPTPSQRFVAQAYLDLLQRSADTAGLNDFSNGLDQGRFTRLQVVQTIMSSAEYRTRLIRNLYATLLGREADPAGLSTFLGLLAAGGTVAQVRAVLLGSAEYYQTRAGGTNAGFLQALYRDVLGRPLDSVGQSGYSQALTAGASRTDVAGVVLTSTEALRGQVQVFYRRFLRREPDPGGWDGFVASLRQGTREEQVIGLILAADEYAARL